MPKVSKIRTPESQRKNTSLACIDRDRYYCSRCGKSYPRQQRCFPASQSLLYRGSGGYLTTCCTCIDELFQFYKKILGDERSAMYRMCMKFDIYWNQDIFDMLAKTGVNSSRVRSYITKTNFNRYIGKTFDDTIEEERVSEVVARHDVSAIMTANEGSRESLFDPDDEVLHRLVDDEQPVDQEVIEFWGYGYAKGFYFDLDARFKKWTNDLPKPIDNAIELLYKQICLLECSIDRDNAAGRPIDKNVNTLNALLGSANLKPSQRKDEDSDASFDGLPFGVGIKMY